MKKLLMTVALAAMLALPASARVRFGVSIGGPAYYGPPAYSTYCNAYGCYPSYYGGYYRPYYYGYYSHGYYGHGRYDRHYRHYR